MHWTIQFFFQLIVAIDCMRKISNWNKKFKQIEQIDGVRLFDDGFVQFVGFSFIEPADQRLLLAIVIVVQIR